VDCSNQHHAQPDPEQTRKPTESLTSENGPGDWTCRRYRRKVLTEEIKGSSGNEVDAVINAICRRCAVIVEFELFCYPTAIETIGSGKQQQESER
jgi:hypothetical protein